MIIGIDLDGVLYNWHQAVYTELSIYWNLDVEFTEFWSGMYKTYKNEMFWDNLVKLKHLYSNQPPDQRNVDLVNLLSGKHTIYYVTNRPKEVYDVTLNWLKRYEFPSVKNLVFTDDKLVACNSLGITKFVEDRTANIDRLLSGDIEVYIIRQPYNQDDLYKFPTCRVVNNFYDLKGIIDAELG